MASTQYLQLNMQKNPDLETGFLPATIASAFFTPENKYEYSEAVFGLTVLMLWLQNIITTMVHLYKKVGMVVI
mgnify:CR=1 FL=1